MQDLSPLATILLSMPITSDSVFMWLLYINCSTMVTRASPFNLL